MRRTGGFTLVEVIVALAIGAIVVLAVNKAFGLGLLLWRRVETRRPFEEQGRHIVGMLRAELAGLYMPPMAEGAGDPFQHDQRKETGERKLSFFTATPSYYRGLPPGRCARVTYEYRRLDAQDDSDGVLIRREQLVAGEKPLAEPVAEVIAKGLKAFSIECKRDGDNRGGPPADQDSSQPPETIRLEMTWAANGPVTVRGQPVSFLAQFSVPVQSSLLPEESSQ